MSKDIDSHINTFLQTIISDIHNCQDVDCYCPEPGEYAAEARQLKQAFIDAGWVQTHPVIVSKGDTPVTIVPGNVMTGQEWYDRFKKELQDWLNGAYSGDADAVLEAAKKAAGLEQ